MKNELRALLGDLMKRKGNLFISTIVLTVITSFLQGITILMLVPLMDIMEVGSSTDLPFGLSRVLDYLLGFPFGLRILLVLLCFTFIMTVQAVTVRFVKIRTMKLASGFTADMREEYYDELMNSSFEKYASDNQSVHVDALITQIPRLTTTINYFMSMMTNALTAFIDLIIAFSLSASLSIFVIIVGGIFFLIFRRFTKRSEEIGNDITRQYEAFTDEVQTQLSGFKEIKSYGISNEESVRFKDRTESFRDIMVEATKNVATPRMISTIGEAVLISVIFFCAEYFLHIETSSMVVVLYVFYRIWPLIPATQEYIQGIKESLPAYKVMRDVRDKGPETGAKASEKLDAGPVTGTKASEIAEQTAAAGTKSSKYAVDAESSTKVAEASAQVEGKPTAGTSAQPEDNLTGGASAQAEGEPTAGTSAQVEDNLTAGTSSQDRAAGEPAIAFESVTFRYRDASSDALSDVSFEIAPNTITAFTGPSGAGKSTVVDLILGFLNPTDGRIRLQVGAGRIAYVPQSPMILTASVRENIARFHPGITDGEIVEALVKTEAMGFLERKCTDGQSPLDLRMGDDGVMFSGGEVQRIVLARAIAGTPELLILDEATSALDFGNEKLIAELLRRLRSEMTIIIVAHRVSTIQTADDILIIENGKLTGHGSSEELLKNPDSYLTKMKDG